MWVLGWWTLCQERVAAQERFEQLSIGVGKIGKVGKGAASNTAAGKDSPAKPVPPQGVMKRPAAKKAKKAQTIPDVIIAMLAMETKIKTVISQATKT